MFGNRRISASCRSNPRKGSPPTSCNLRCRKLGLGGLCPHCDEPVLIAELKVAVTRDGYRQGASVTGHLVTPTLATIFAMWLL